MSNPERSPQPDRRRRLPTVVLTIAAAGGLAAGGYGIASAASPSPSPSSSSAATPGTDAPTPPAGAPTAGARPDGTRPDGAMRGGPGSEGRVTAVGTSSITVTSDSGTATVYRTSSATTVHQGPDQKVALSTLRVGDRVHVAAPTASGSTAATATDIDVRLPHLDGTVTAVGSGTVTITDRDGFTRTIVTSGSTTYAKDGATAARSAVTTGVRVGAQGRVDANGTSLDATRVDVVTKAPTGGPGNGGPMGGPGGGGPMGGHRGGPKGGPGAGERPNGTGGTASSAPSASPSASASASPSGSIGS